MSILEAVIVIAGVIKQIADDSSANASMVKSLATRVEIIPRILKKIPCLLYTSPSPRDS